MSARVLDALMLRLYPAQWRSRYGEELATLMVDSGGNRGTSWRMRGDVAAAAVRERLRATGLSGNEASPPEQARTGALLVLCGWMLFVAAGLGVSKFSEHWQDATPVNSRGLPSAAFDGLRIAAAIGTLFVVSAIVAASPSLVRFLRSGGWPQIRRRVLTAVAMSGLIILGAAALVAWAHGLSVQQRNGGDLAYSIAFVTWAVAGTACLISWTIAAVATARRLHLSTIVLRLSTWIATAVCLAMAAMTTATLTWWSALGEASTRGLMSAQLLVYTSSMVLATVVGAVGAARALRALPALSQSPLGER